MINRAMTDILADALRGAGLAVHDVVRRTHPEESDLIHLDADYYVAVGYDDLERFGITHVSLNQSMHSGGDIEIESWMAPDASPEQIVAEIAAYEFE